MCATTSSAPRRRSPQEFCEFNLADGNPVKEGRTRNPPKKQEKGVQIEYPHRVHVGALHTAQTLPARLSDRSTTRTEHYVNASPCTAPALAKFRSETPANSSREGVTSRREVRLLRAPAAAGWSAGARATRAWQGLLWTPLLAWAASPSPRSPPHPPAHTRAQTPNIFIRIIVFSHGDCVAISISRARACLLCKPQFPTNLKRETLAKAVFTSAWFPLGNQARTYPPRVCPWLLGTAAQNSTSSPHPAFSHQALNSNTRSPKTASSRQACEHSSAFERPIAVSSEG